MTWDKPTKRICPDCGSVIYQKYTKEEKKYLCYKPGCGYEELMPERKTRKKADPAEGGEEAPKKRGRKPKAETEAAAAAAEAPKKSGRKPKAETEAAKAANEETPKKKPGRKKKTDEQ